MLLNRTCSCSPELCIMECQWSACCFGNSRSLGSTYYTFSSSWDSLAPPVAWPDFQLLSYLSSNTLILFYHNSISVFASDDTDIHIQPMGVLLALRVPGPLCSLFPPELLAPRPPCALRIVAHPRRQFQMKFEKASPRHSLLLLEIVLLHQRQ